MGMPQLSGYSCQVATFATLGAIIVVATCLTITLRVVRERTHTLRRFRIALVAFCLSAAFLYFELPWIRSMGSGAFALLLIPLGVSLLAMTAAAAVGMRDGTLGRRAWIAPLGELGAVGIAILFVFAWQNVRMRDQLYRAAEGGDVHATQAFIAQSTGVESRAVRQRLLVDAATDLDFEVIRTLVAARVDVNGVAPDRSHHLTTPLLAVVTARKPEGSTMTDAEFNTRRMRTIDFLLRRGADPNRRARADGQTPVEAAREASLDDARALMESNAARPAP